MAAQSKRNLQIDRAAFPEAAQLDKLVGQSLVDHPTFRISVLPARVLAPRYAKYEQGMSYGPHADNPLMQQGTGFVRTDISATVFLNRPEDYEGGELVLRWDMGTRRVKFARGDAIVYSTNIQHEVTEVTSGERRVAVTWAQSMIADERQRTTLYELDRTIQALRRRPELRDGAEIRSLIQTYGNMFRMWASF